MVNEYGLYSGEKLLRTVKCGSQKAASKKAKFLYGVQSFMIEVKLISKNIEI